MKTPTDSTDSTGSEPRQRAPLWVKLLVGVGVTVGTIVGLEGLLSLIWIRVDYAAHVAEQPKAIEHLEDFHAEYDPELGWRNIPGKRITSFYGPGADITINQDGLRGTADYIGKKEPGTYRVVCLGDSFTLGYGVGDAESYPAQLQALNPAVQVVNMGQGGYSIGQCYLWYRQLEEQLEADLVVFAVISDDFLRLGYERMPNGCAMPQFELDGDEIRVTNLPVPAKIDTGEPVVSPGGFTAFLWKESSMLRSMKRIFGGGGQDLQHPERLADLGTAMFRSLYVSSVDRGTRFVVCLLPAIHELEDQASLQRYRFFAVKTRKACRQAGIAFLDLMPDFAKQGRAAQGFFLEEAYHHYSPRGNAFVARRIHGWLQNAVRGYPSADPR